MSEKKPVDTITPVPAGTFGRPTPATLENSTTMAVILASQKRWKIGAGICGLISTAGFAVAGAFPVVPVAFAVGLGVGIVGAIGTLVCGAFSGAELDEKAIQAVADRVAVLVDRRPKP